MPYATLAQITNPLRADCYCRECGCYKHCACHVAIRRPEDNVVFILGSELFRVAVIPVKHSDCFIIVYQAKHGEHWQDVYPNPLAYPQRADTEDDGIAAARKWLAGSPTSTEMERRNR